MAVPPKKWQLPPAVTRHSLPVDLPSAAVQVLLGRGIDSRETLKFFLEPPHRLPHDPLRLPGMDRAIRRLYQAVSRKETVGVFGDFDVDGVTGTAIIAEGLASLDVPVVPYLPHRIGEGHGLSSAAIQHLVEQGVTLLVTVDCGVGAVAEVSEAQRLGADVIITDHHLPQDSLPEAEAVVNPKLPGSNYPFPELCGAGLAFKLIQGLYQYYGQPSDPSLLELAALATIADLVPMVDENRYLVKEGLRVMARTERPGLQALFRRARVDRESLNAQTVAFQISPRLNSAGRMSHALESYRLLTTKSMEEAESLAERLEDLNRQRRDISEQAIAAALEQVHSRSVAGDLPPILMVWDDCITPGVAGLVAGRLVDLYHRPSVALAADGDHLVASARGIPEFNLVDAFSACHGHLVRYGGHAQAAGFTVARDNLPELVEDLTAFARNKLGFLDLSPTLTIDAVVELDDLTNDLFQWLQDLEPCGPANPTPVFLTQGVPVSEVHYMGRSKQHLRLAVGNGNDRWTALAFNQADRWNGDTPRLDLVYSITADSWRGPEALALRVLDFRPAPD